jgi:hypothetical protein
MLEVLASFHLLVELALGEDPFADHEKCVLQDIF